MAIGQEAKRFEVRLWVISGHSCDRCPLYLRKANIQKREGRSLQRKKNYIGSSPGFTRCGAFSLSFLTSLDISRQAASSVQVGSNHFIDSIQWPIPSTIEGDIRVFDRLVA